MLLPSVVGSVNASLTLKDPLVTTSPPKIDVPLTDVPFEPIEPENMMFASALVCVPVPSFSSIKVSTLLDCSSIKSTSSSK